MKHIGVKTVMLFVDIQTLLDVVSFLSPPVCTHVHIYTQTDIYVERGQVMQSHSM